jgi:hypothetical protein
LAEFTTLAREGKTVPEKLMAQVNGRKVVDNQRIHATAPKGALFLASSRKKCEEINKEAFNHLVRDGGVESLRIWAYHTRGKSRLFDETARVNALSKCPVDTSDQYYKWLGSCRNTMDLCIGSRVRYLLNTCPIVGLFQGAIGTVVGFGIPPGHTAEEYSRKLTLEEAARLNLPVPLVYVKMDMCDDFISEWKDTKGVVCFKAEQTPSSANGHPRFMLPILPAHARTYHSAQGLTAFFGVVLYRPIARTFALMYVGISRIKQLANLYLIDRVSSEDFSCAPDIMANVRREMIRLRELPNQV